MRNWVIRSNRTENLKKTGSKYIGYHYRQEKMFKKLEENLLKKLDYL